MLPGSAAGGDGRPPRGGAAEWWHRLIPGQYFEVEYVDDDVAHERLALWPVDLDTWVVRSPDGDMWPEDLSGGDPSSGPMLSRPARRRMAKKGPHAGSLPPVYRFRERLEGPSLKTAVVRGLVAATEVVELERTPVVTHFVDEDGERLPLDVAFGATISPLMRRAGCLASPRGWESARGPCSVA